jgi:hypothetical protein
MLSCHGRDTPPGPERQNFFGSLSTHSIGRRPRINFRLGPCSPYPGKKGMAGRIEKSYNHPMNFFAIRGREERGFEGFFKIPPA